MTGESPRTKRPIDRAYVQERYEAAVLTVSRIRSDEINGDVQDDDLLSYYEGKRDALRELLQPQEASS